MYQILDHRYKPDLFKEGFTISPFRISMGNANSIRAAKAEQDTEQSVIGHWVTDFKTGYRWATDPIQSDETVQKVPLGETVPRFEDSDILKALGTQITYLPSSYYKPSEPGEVWGPYKKQFTKSSFGQNIFTPPESIDGIPLLCRAREIRDYVRDESGGRTVNALYALLFGKTPPACYDDNETITNPYGGMYFFVVIRHPDFYNYAQSKNGSRGVLMNQFTQPRVTGIIPSFFAAKQLLSSNAKPADAIPAGITILKSFFGGKTKRKHRVRNRTLKMRHKIA